MLVLPRDVHPGDVMVVDGERAIVRTVTRLDVGYPGWLFQFHGLRDLIVASNSPVEVEP